MLEVDSGSGMDEVEVEGKELMNKRAYLNMMIVVMTVLLCLWIFAQQLKRHSPVFNEKSVFNKPLVVLDFHSSGGTIDRTGLYIRDMTKHQVVQSGQMRIQVVLSRLAFPSNNDPYFVGVDCNDGRNGEGGLVCRVERGYSHFLSEFPNCGWYYKAMDDTWVDPGKLYDYVRQLSRVYDPFQHLVLIGHANHEKLRNYYLHGGSGWLMSRAMIEYQRRHNLSLITLLRNSRYQQDDTAQTIIVRHIFKSTKYWDEMLISGFVYLDDIWDDLPPCPALTVCARVNQIFAQHTFGHSETMKKLVDKITNASDNIMFYRDDPNQAIHLCKQTLTTQQWKIRYVKPPYLLDTDIGNETVNSINQWIDDMT